MPVKGKYLSREKATKEMVKVASLIGAQHVKNTGSRAVAHKDTDVQGIIQGDSQADVLSVVLLVTILLNAHVQWSRKLRMPSGLRLHGSKMRSSGKTLSGRLRSMKRPRARKIKWRDLSQKGSLKARRRRDLLLPGHRRLHLRGDRSQPKAKPEARSCMTNDFLFAMMSTKSKPTWRHSTWNGIDYIICTVADSQKKLPVCKPGKWSLLPDSRISLYGHEAKSMKNLTLHFDMAEQCDSLDRSWFGESVVSSWESMSIRCSPHPLKIRFQIQQILALKRL